MARRLSRELDEAIARLEGSTGDRDLISIVCHDLKDPLASIVMGAGFLRKTTSADDSAARRVVEAIARSAERMTQVVGDFHDVAKLESASLPIDLRPCDVVAALQAPLTTLTVQARDRRIELRFEHPGRPVVALCDRARLVQIVSKLVGNALRFTPPEGQVVLGVQGQAQTVQLSVRDTGRGIAPDRLNDIFDRAANARRVPRDGPGLGLAIVRGLVDLHRGAIVVESRVGEGSTFTVSLPAAHKGEHEQA